MDGAGMMLIGLSILMLAGRIAAAFLKRRALHAKLRQHHKNVESIRGPLFYHRLSEAWIHIDARWKISSLDARLKLAVPLALGMIVLRVAPPRLHAIAGVESVIGRAIEIALRWTLVAGFARTAKPFIWHRIKNYKNKNQD